MINIKNMLAVKENCDKSGDKCSNDLSRLNDLCERKSLDSICRANTFNK